MRITSKGQVTIPQAIREQLGLLPDTEVDFVVENGGAKLVKRSNHPTSRGNKVVSRLRGTGSIEMTTDEILALTRR